jgi:cation transport ATPase
LRKEGQRQFLARYRRSPQRVWIDRDGSLLEISMAQLPAGETIVLREGDTVPGDGVVLDGRAEVRESWITGAPGDARKQPGDALYASSELSRGEIRARIDSVGEQTTAGRLTSWYARALRQPSLKIKSERLANSMVLPVLIFGVAALARGGVSMTKAVIRPDYFTGPAIAEELSELLTIIQAAEAGFYIADQSMLDRLAEADCWIFDDSVPWISSERNGTGVAAKLRAKGIAEVLFLSSQSGAGAASAATALGFDQWHAGSSPAARKNYIAQRQFLGRNVAYFGNCAQNTAAAEQADVAISVLAGREFSAPPASIALLHPDLTRCGVLLSLTRARASSIGSAFTASLVPNIAAMSGAIYLDFSALTSVILTNLGTLANYYRWRRTLKSVQ